MSKVEDACKSPVEKVEPLLSEVLLNKSGDQSSVETSQQISHKRYLQTPCCSCGKTLIEYRDDISGVYDYNSHLFSDERIHFLDQWYQPIGYNKKLPLYKCGKCIRLKERKNIKRYVERVMSGYCAETSCRIVPCLEWNHYAYGD